MCLCHSKESNTSLCCHLCQDKDREDNICEQKLQHTNRQEDGFHFDTYTVKIVHNGVIEYFRAFLENL